MERNKELQCSTCGGTGNACLMAICDLCKDVSAHYYCMKIMPPFDVPLDHFHCEDCENKKLLKDRKGKSPLITIEIGSNSKKKSIVPPQIGKVKYIPETEITFLNAQKFAKRMSLDQIKSKKTRRVTDILRDETKYKAVRHEIDKVEGKKPACISPNSQHEKLNNDNFPIQNPTWKGGLAYFEHVNHVHNVEAHLAQNAALKVVEISKKLPQIQNLNLKVKFMKEAYPKAFKSAPPTQKDIGFYFFSSEISRLKEKFIRLVERLNNSHQMLVCQLGSLHLLIFSSQLLPKSTQCIHGEPYLWGVLIHYKKKKKQTQVHVGSRSNISISTKKQGKRVCLSSHASGSEPSRGRLRL